MKLSHLYDYVDGSETKFLMYALLLISLFLGTFFHVVVVKKINVKTSSDDVSKKNAFLIFFIIIAGAFLEFGVARVIPIVSVLRGSGYEYKNF
ncbi:hypothetical protein ACQFN5_08100 [Klebsiella sp. WOUb02]|uniref:hypothetical protein n=1 Tax=Klebsiella sp. WOUb02 TaxID=3161071 RepID=UPI003CE84099